MEKWLTIAASALGGLGIGSLITTFLKEIFEKKQLHLKERHKSYSGYLEALQNCVAEPTEENKQKVVYWHKRIELVAPDDICEICQNMYEIRPSEGISLRDKLVKLMRQDLNFYPLIFCLFQSQQFYHKILDNYPLPF